MKRLATALLLAGTALSTPAYALLVPTPDTDTELRIRHVPYAPNDVVQIIAPAVGETQVVLSPEETKFDVSVVSKEWRHDSAGNTFVLAPNPGAPTTVAHVVSYLPDGTTRRYALELTAAAEGVKMIEPLEDARVASNDPSAVPASRPIIPYLSVRVTYEKEEAAAKVAAAAAQKTAAIAAWRARRAAGLETQGDARARAILATEALNQRRRCNFMWRGDASLLPTAACDTGATTTFLWPGQMPTAAIFVGLCRKDMEQSVTQAPDPNRPGLVVVPTTSQFWCIRRGDQQVAELYNASFDPIGLDTGTNTLSPRVTTRLRAATGGQP